MTPLDALCQIPFHDADAPERARILSRFADTELFAALVAEPADDRAELRLFDLPEGAFALACDAEDRLAGFLGGPVAYLAMPGRVLAATLAQEGRGLIVNPGHPSELMLDAPMLEWLVGALAAQPDIVPEAAARQLSAPARDAVALLAEPLAQRLGDMTGLVGQLALVSAQWQDGRRNHTLILRGVDPARQTVVAKAMAELLAFLPELPGGVDVAFSESAIPRGALVLEPPPPPPPPATDDRTPRRDPQAPPRLR